MGSWSSKSKAKNSKGDRGRQENPAPPPNAAETVKKLVSDKRLIAGAALSVFTYAFLVALWRKHRRNDEQHKSKAIQDKIERAGTKAVKQGVNPDDLRFAASAVAQQDANRPETWPGLVTQLRGFIGALRRGNGK